METKYAFARQIIKEAGLFIKSKMSEQLDIQVKTQFDDLVTNVDQETQQLLMDRIHQTYPCDAILLKKMTFVTPLIKEMFGSSIPLMERLTLLCRDHSLQ